MSLLRMDWTRRPLRLCRWAGIFAGSVGVLFSADVPVAERLQELAAQNARLQEQVRVQQQQIDELRELVTGLNRSGEQRDREVKALRERGGDEPVVVGKRSAPSGREVRLSGEAGVAFFRTGSEGFSPNSEFRIDDAKLFVEAPIAKNIYLFAGLELVTREAADEYFHVGEVYADFEKVTGFWDGKGTLNVRVGRFGIPFGEEYQRRGMLADPLISHSLSDIWGIDEGVEVYGAVDRFSYVVAVQNGGHKTLRDYDSDKAVVARIGFDPVEWGHLSVSAMRTGDLTAAGDGSSELWIGNGFFRALGFAATTFSARLMEVDGSVHWTGGDVRAGWGEARFEDNDRAANNARKLRYGFLEIAQDLMGKWYGAARVSEIKVPGGYPLVGHGDFGAFVFRRPPTRDLRRISLGLGYRFNPALVWKAEYAWENGRLTTGVRRDREDLLSTQLALQF